MTKFEILFAQLQSDYKFNEIVNPMKITAIKAEIAINPHQSFIDEEGEFITIGDMYELWMDFVVSEESWKREMLESVVTDEEVAFIDLEIKLSRFPVIGNMLINFFRNQNAASHA